MTHVTGTTPYAWPYDGRLDPERLVLVVTGWDDHWAAATAPSADVITNLGRMARGAPRVLTVGHPRPRRTTVTGHGPALPDLGADHLVAAGIDAFHGSRLDAELRSTGATHLVMAGLGLETTVHSTMRRANDMGLECLLVADACSPVDPGLVPGAISSVEMSGGIFGAIGSTRAVLAALAALTSPETAATDKESA